MRRWIFLLALAFCSCSSHSANPENANNGAKGGKGQPNQAPSAAVVRVPDPHASNDPKVGHEAGVGDDPSNLQADQPDTGEPGSGGRQAHAKN